MPPKTPNPHRASSARARHDLSSPPVLSLPFPADVAAFHLSGEGLPHKIGAFGTGEVAVAMAVGFACLQLNLAVRDRAEAGVEVE
jgi:hypothetical protein